MFGVTAAIDREQPLAIYAALYAFLSLYFFSQAIEALRPRSARFFRDAGMPGDSDQPAGGCDPWPTSRISSRTSTYEFWREANIDQLCREVAYTAQSMAAINMDKYRALERVYRGLIALTGLTALLLTALAYIGFNR